MSLSSLAKRMASSSKCIATQARGGMGLASRSGLILPSGRALSTFRVLAQAQPSSSSSGEQSPSSNEKEPFPILVGPPPLPPTGHETSLEYFPDQLLVGSSYAAERVVEAIAKEDRAFMKRVMTEELYDRLTKAMDREASKASSSSSSPLQTLSYHSIKDAQVRDVWVQMGGTSQARSKELVPYQLFTLSSYVRPKEGFFSLPGTFFNAMDSGIHFDIDVEISGLLQYQDIKKPRKSVWRFTSPHFPSPKEVRKAWNPVTGGSWQWVVSDIEGIMETEKFEAQMRRARENLRRDPSSRPPRPTQFDLLVTMHATSLYLLFPLIVAVAGVYTPDGAKGGASSSKSSLNKTPLTQAALEKHQKETSGSFNSSHSSSEGGHQYRW
ncbi:hypothetical protein BJ684DRAFT_19743 [Piptocephalis cylindrospora]|uniref:Uncharacterized protein n=1 Tax=Piptocephalis cylindrospora TaxID=1907219 RepID=A0A4P9Y4D3_9FUNG|nr:hypothetical protein BJ684DRAFT_19743 [Piptocephalis cylindrospora]|eukprot:RKP13797.1 hypothetical protein BJ684DRAFT_19743 [Piptocephalis cylindrospora]